LADPPSAKDVPDFAAIASRPVPADPSVRTGVLANGLRYAIRRSELPKGGVSIRLGIKAGSFDDPDGDNGAAHFVEHMAFRSTRHYPDNSVDGAFAKSGVAFGRDQNAATRLFTTAFAIDLPRSDEADRQTALVWLRDVADGVVFDPAAVEKERGVVLAEEEARDDGDVASYWALLKFRAPGLRSTDRAPIGRDAVLRTLGPERLKAFYQRWYRPDNAVVVMAGDLPPDVMEADLKRAFGSWTATDPAPIHAAYGAVQTTRGPDFFTRSDGSSVPTVDICKEGPTDAHPPQDYGALRRWALAAIWRETIDRRLAQLRLVPQNHILIAGVDAADDDSRDHREACLSIATTDSVWAPGLAAGQAELRRFQTSGPTDLEVEQAIDVVRGRVRGDVAAAPNRTASASADAILDRLLDGKVIPDPLQRLRGYDLAVEDITPADVLAAFKAEWSGGGPLVSVVTSAAPSAAEVEAAWLSGERRPALPPYIDRKDVEWGYTFKPPGKIVSREIEPFGAFVRLRFANGVVLNFKHTAFRKGDVAFVVSFGSGDRQLANQDRIAAAIGGPLVILGGVGKHYYEDLERFTQADVHSLSLHIQDESFSISGTQPVANMEDELKICAALLQDPAFRPSLDPVLREAIALFYRKKDTTPVFAAEAALETNLAPDSPLALPPEAELLKIDSARLAQVLKPVMTQEPLHIALVGDIDEATAIDLVANSLGALPPRAIVNRDRTDTVYLRYPETPPPPLRVAHHGPPEKAFAELRWPLYVATPERRREEYSLRLLSAIFAAELRRKARGDLAKTYSPTVVSKMPDHADQGAMVAAIESYPADLDELVAAARATARTLASGAITPAELEAARAPLLAEGRRALEYNSLWADALARSDTSDQELHDILGYTDLIGDVRLDEVKAAAAEWLSQTPVVVLATPAPPKKAAP
jgi:zinc protease